ncbi:hypothetical protein [Pontimicrobium aquaticum]|nr:hypothetical protein [Pontimicrobium aquaticum]
MASILPIPIVYYGKDNLPKNLTELVEKNTDDDDNEDIKKLF